MGGGRATGGIPPLRVVFPTAHRIQRSLEGWVSGASLPCMCANAAKLRDRLRQLSGHSGLAKLCDWDGGDGDGGGVGACNRAQAVPHIKTYARYAPDRSLAWALLTSSNLSQAAWGALEKNGSQLYIKSYEVGVLFLPSLAPGGKLCAAPRGAEDRVGDATVVPLPFSIPPKPYTASDLPWSFTVMGRTDGPSAVLPGRVAVSGGAAFDNEADQHGLKPGDYWGASTVRSMQQYGGEATVGAQLAESWSRRFR